MNVYLKLDRIMVIVEKKSEIKSYKNKLLLKETSYQSNIVMNVVI